MFRRSWTAGSHLVSIVSEPGGDGGGGHLAGGSLDVRWAEDLGRELRLGLGQGRARGAVDTVHLYVRTKSYYLT